MRQWAGVWAVVGVGEAAEGVIGVGVGVGEGSVDPPSERVEAAFEGGPETRDVFRGAGLVGGVGGDAAVAGCGAC